MVRSLFYTLGMATATVGLKFYTLGMATATVRMKFYTFGTATATVGIQFVLHVGYSYIDRWFTVYFTSWVWLQRPLV